MNSLMRWGTAAILVVALVIIWLVASRPGAVGSQDPGLPPVFAVGATITLDFGSPPWHIEEIRGQWARVTDASSEPQFTGTFWVNLTTGRFWAVR